MHGLGADASDMMGLADQLTINGIAIRHLFIDAPMRAVTLNNGMIMPAWYDIAGVKLVDREDEAGITESEEIIRNVMESQFKEGFQPSQIFLAGFSQGGAMALHTALHTKAALGGVIALSAYLPLANINPAVLDKKTPFFMGAGQFDPLVLPEWSVKSKYWLIAQGYTDIAYHQYPMEHSVCYQEVQDVSLWLSEEIKKGIK